MRHNKAAPADGSSPRARGTPRSAMAPGVETRFIPACAGNTGARHRGASPNPVHPRVCGEHVSSSRRSRSDSGSSPRARGTPRCWWWPPTPGRFIPTCAGNTRSPLPTRASSSVHPRVRGEHPSVGFSPICTNGSSPRARGTRRDHQRNARTERFIPACAGNTRIRPQPVPYAAVHPRVRGEHASRPGSRWGAVGSSPRARGTRHRWRPWIRPRRFIPACAGNTRRRTPPTHSRAVHPRVRGEHLMLSLDRHREHGSSPRARGTPRRLLDSLELRRFIPACAGNTAAMACSSVPVTVHPRVRGEHAISERV